MKTNEIKEVLEDMGLDFRTISFYTDIDSNGNTFEASDLEFGICDVSGVEGMLVTCVAVNDKGSVSTFQVISTLVHGKLGALCGAF